MGLDPQRPRARHLGGAPHRDMTGNDGVVDTLLPHDLLFTDVMTLVRARTREDFASALRAKSRLGRYMN
jgi:hypothetical protein